MYRDFEISTDWREGQKVLLANSEFSRMSRGKKRALETVVDVKTSLKATVISSADGAKVQQIFELNKLIYKKSIEYGNESKSTSSNRRSA